MSFLFTSLIAVVVVWIHFKLCFTSYEQIFFLHENELEIAAAVRKPQQNNHSQVKMSRVDVLIIACILLVPI